MSCDFEKQELKILESIKKYGGFPDCYSEQDIDLALEYAIESVKLRIPTKVISRKWNPNKCPTCLASLGGKCNDGYWENPRYDKCPLCGQLLEREE